MDYLITGSNSVKTGQALNVDITVSALTYPSIGLGGDFELSNLNEIVSADDMRSLSCELWAKTSDDRISTVPVKLSTLIPGARGNFMVRLGLNIPVCINFEIRLRGALCTWQDSSKQAVKLDLSFYDGNNAESGEGDRPIDLPILIQLAQSPPVIAIFSADKSVLLANSASLTINWVINEGNDSYTLFDGTTEIIHINNPDKTGKYIFKTISAGNHAYSLHLNKGSITSKKSMTVRALERSACFMVPAPENDARENLIISNVCVSEDSSVLFSLILKKDSSTSSINAIGYSNEGFTGNWKFIQLTEADKIKLEPFKLSPLVHLKDTNQALGRLVFIGGSLVSPTHFSNSIAIVNLEKNASKEDLVSVISDCSWLSRMGHRCLVFPHQGVDKIWLMGGQDEYGTALNDIWVSENGVDWRRIDGDGAYTSDLDTPTPWEARCFFGATALLDNQEGKQALWIGGGFSETGGTQTQDVWIWDQVNWKQAKTGTGNLSICKQPYLSSALAAISIDTRNNPVDATGIYAFGAYDVDSTLLTYFESISLKTTYGIIPVQTPLQELTNHNYSTMITLYFKGCLWYMVLTDNGDAGIVCSHLYYWVPPVTSYILK